MTSVPTIVRSGPPIPPVIAVPPTTTAGSSRAPRALAPAYCDEVGTIAAMSCTAG